MSTDNLPERLGTATCWNSLDNLSCACCDDTYLLLAEAAAEIKRLRAALAKCSPRYMTYGEGSFDVETWTEVKCPVCDRQSRKLSTIFHTDDCAWAEARGGLS